MGKVEKRLQDRKEAPKTYPGNKQDRKEPPRQERGFKT
jgi:hypothetical protein